MRFRFDEARATQAAAYLLHKSSGVMPYLKLIKLIYIADRRALLHWGKPVTGARAFAMSYGPVVSEVYDLIKKPRPTDLWSRHIERVDRNVRLVQAAAAEDLCQAELDLLDTIYEEFKTLNKWRTVDMTHEMPEWSDPGPNRRRPIQPEDILRVAGKSADEIRELQEENNHYNYVQARYGAQ